MGPEVIRVVAITTEALVLVMFAVLSILLSRIDMRTRRIPNEVVVPGIVLSLGLVGAASLSRSVIDADGDAWWQRLAPSVGGSLGLALLLLLLVLIAPGKIGFGDVKLALLVGLVVGYMAGLTGVLVALAVMFVAGAVASLVTIAMRRHETHLAFAPFMCLGAWVSIAGSWIAPWIEWI